jgi:hypothetical protein
MRVAVDEDVAAISSQQQLWPRAAELVAVTDMDGERAHLQCALPWQTRVSSIVDVAGYRFDWSDLGQLPKNVRAADIAGMDDEVYACQRRAQLQAKQAMRVRDQADDGH